MPRLDLNFFSNESIIRLIDIINKHQNDLPLANADGSHSKMTSPEAIKLLVSIQDIISSALTVMANDLKSKFGVSRKLPIAINLSLDGSKRLEDIEKFLQEVFSVMINMREDAIKKYPEAKSLFEGALGDGSLLKVMLSVLFQEDLVQLNKNQLVAGANVLDALSKL